MAMVGYKKIIENRVEHQVALFIEKQARTEENPYRFAWIIDGSMKLTADQELGHPTFDVDYRVSENHYGSYHVHGYVDPYGDATITMITYERDLVKDNNRDDWWSKDNIEHKRFYVYGDDLNSFRFDA